VHLHRWGEAHRLAAEIGGDTGVQEEERLLWIDVVTPTREALKKRPRNASRHLDLYRKKRVLNISSSRPVATSQGHAAPAASGYPGVGSVQEPWSNYGKIQGRKDCRHGHSPKRIAHICGGLTRYGQKALPPCEEALTCINFIAASGVSWVGVAMDIFGSPQKRNAPNLPQTYNADGA